METIEKIYLSFYFLYSFKYLREDIVVKNFLELLETIIKNQEIEQNLKKYISFVEALNNLGYKDFSKYLENLIAVNKPYLADVEQNKKELSLIYEVSKIDYDLIKGVLEEKFEKYSEMFNNLPYFLNTKIEIDFNNLDKIINKNGDVYKNERAFIFNGSELKPVDFCDDITFKDLKGYKEQKRVLFENTKAFLNINNQNNRRVNNILLYGDAGCGKSSSVRALLNEFREIKMVQIFKNNLINLDKLYSILKDIPYKFIIFADDISFKEDDETFSTMKAILEGALIQCPKNAVIYATSNRRHLVRESFQARYGDEIHLGDTLNEITSLSERFGINLLFMKPSNDEFCSIVLELAHDNKIDLSDEEILSKAQKLALIKGSKSPRIARQLINNLACKINLD